MGVRVIGTLKRTFTTKVFILALLCEILLLVSCTLMLILVAAFPGSKGEDMTIKLGFCLLFMLVMLIGMVSTIIVFIVMRQYDENVVTYNDDNKTLVIKRGNDSFLLKKNKILKSDYNDLEFSTPRGDLILYLTGELYRVSIFHRRRDFGRIVITYQDKNRTRKISSNKVENVAFVAQQINDIIENW